MNCVVCGGYTTGAYRQPFDDSEAIPVCQICFQSDRFFNWRQTKILAELEDKQ